jgi:uncharacterized membrane protein YqjE
MNKKPEFISNLIQVIGFTIPALLLIILVPSVLIVVHRDYPLYAMVSGLSSMLILILVSVILLMRLMNTDAIDKRVMRLECDHNFIEAMAAAQRAYEETTAAQDGEEIDG